MPVPITQYVLKVHSRCNLACDHCYVYEHADQSWRTKPSVMSPEVMSLSAKRISEHVAAHQVPDVSIVLHGGEPLLLGHSRMRDLLGELTEQVGAVTRLDLRVHTNGVLLNQRWCDLFREYGVKVGVSLDGDQAANDRHRRFADGRGSHAQVLNALRLLRRLEYRHLYAGILATVDLVNDPVAVYQALSAEEPPNVDLLLPHATWDRPPFRPDGRPAPYADWLLRVFWCWDADGRRMPIRIFDSLLSAARGGQSFTEALGTEPASLLVVETNGDWEQPDSMKTAYDGAAATGMNVVTHAVDEVRAHPAMVARQQGTAGLSEACRACHVVDVCGGGLYAHRFRARQRLARAGEAPGVGAGFGNPSVYCADLMALISGVLAAERHRARPSAVRMRDEGNGQAAPRKAAGRAAHALSTAEFDRLAAGPGDEGGLAVLAGRRLSEVGSLVTAVAKSEVGWRDAGLRAAAEQGWDLLRGLSRDQPRAVNDVLAHPYTYAWAVRCLRPAARNDADLDRAHLAGLALAAALRAGVPAELLCPVRDGCVHLPLAGSIAASPGRDRTRRMTIRPGRAPAAAGGGRWHAARFVGEQPFSGLAVEDLDPFRDCQSWPAASRLSPSAWYRWRHDLIAAGTHLTETVPGYARVLAAGLRTVTPLRSVAGSRRSATARQAFGAVAAARPGAGAPPGELAGLLLQEFQHVKLNVLMDLRPLSYPGSPVRLRVAWRDDPRSPDTVLHGSYAFLALMHLRRAEGPAGRGAYLRYRSWVHDALAALLSHSEVLTPDGLRFVAGLAEAVETEAT
jgi:uncharacterized protein